MPAQTHEYTPTLTWVRDNPGAPIEPYNDYSRTYTVEFPEPAGKPTITGSASPLFKGDPSLHDPEELLCASAAACHMLSYLAMCSKFKLPIVSYTDSVSATLELAMTGGRFTQMTLRPRCVFASGADADKARELHHKAHEICFIANSVNFPITIEAQIEVQG